MDKKITALAAVAIAVSSICVFLHEKKMHKNAKVDIHLDCLHIGNSTLYTDGTLVSARGKSSDNTYYGWPIGAYCIRVIELRDKMLLLFHKTNDPVSRFVDADCGTTAEHIICLDKELNRIAVYGDTHHSAFSTSQDIESVYMISDCRISTGIIGMRAHEKVYGAININTEEVNLISIDNDFEIAVVSGVPRAVVEISEGLYESILFISEKDIRIRFKCNEDLRATVKILETEGLESTLITIIS